MSAADTLPLDVAFLRIRQSSSPGRHSFIVGMGEMLAGYVDFQIESDAVESRPGEHYLLKSRYVAACLPFLLKSAHKVHKPILEILLPCFKEQLLR